MCQCSRVCGNVSAHGRNISYGDSKLLSTPPFPVVAVFILAYEYLVLGKSTDKGTILSITAVGFFTLVAGWDTLNAEIFGYVITSESVTGTVQANRYPLCLHGNTVGLCNKTPSPVLLCL